jgi:hypothetical protein
MMSGMDEMMNKQLVVGAKVVVTQQIPARARTWTNQVAGTVVSFEQKKTGSWYAHSKDDKLWLDRLVLRKEDGEITTLILDEYSHIDLVSGAPAAA